MANGDPNLLLKEFEPRTVLQVPVHKIERARFPAIDMHQHVNDAMGLFPRRVPRERLAAIMDECNVRRVVILTAMWGEQLQRVIDEAGELFPDRLTVFTQIDWSRIADPEFAPLTVRQIRDAVARGARGLKILKDLGLQVRDGSGKLLTVDDPRLDPICEECAALGIPIAIHTADPEAFFHPLDTANERYEELLANPVWSFCAPGLPTRVSLLEAQQRLFARHPRTAFIALHVGSSAEDLAEVAHVLDRRPNVFVDFGARQNELGRQPRAARTFFEKHQDRILFGTDHPVAEAMYRSYFRWLETDDEYFDYWGYPRQGRWKIYGLALSDQILEKIYHLNAEKIFAAFRGL